MTRFSRVPRWLRRKPVVTYSVCPSCQRQTITVPSEQPANSIREGTSEQARQLVDEQAFDAALDLDALRRQRSAGDPTREQLLADIQDGFIQNVVDVRRRLRRSDEPDGRLR